MSRVFCSHLLYLDTPPPSSASSIPDTCRPSSPSLALTLALTMPPSQSLYIALTLRIPLLLLDEAKMYEKAHHSIALPLDLTDETERPTPDDVDGLVVVVHESRVGDGVLTQNGLPSQSHRRPGGHVFRRKMGFEWSM